LVWPSSRHLHHLWQLPLLARTEVEPYQITEIALTSILGQNVTHHVRQYSKILEMPVEPLSSPLEHDLQLLEDKPVRSYY
jgi:hypothetical protein